MDAADLEAVGVAACMVNAYHLGAEPGLGPVTALGGVHRLMGWRRPLFSDSGGFQILSMLGKVAADAASARGIRMPRAAGGTRLLSPGDAVRRQHRLGADALFCLDYCAHPDEPAPAQRKAVELTLTWAEEGLREHARLEDPNGPLLYGVVQGGADLDLRKRCLEQLIELGVSGLGFGGWPVSDAGQLHDAVFWLAENRPPELPLHGLGIGSPANLVRAVRAGYDTFDCVLPTRDARHGRLFFFTTDPATRPFPIDGYSDLSLKDQRLVRADRPVDATCDCPACQRYSLGYLHHLFRRKDHLAYRLASLHNLRFYMRILQAAR